MNEFIIFVVIALTMWGLVSWLIRKGRAEYQLQALSLQQVATLSIPEAERKALALLDNGNLFRCVAASVADETPMQPLAESLRRVFTRYARVETVSGPKTLIDRALIRPSTLLPEFIRIGRGMEGTDVQFELGVRANEEPVYEIYPHEKPDPTFGTYASVYHWIVATASETNEQTGNQHNE